MITIYTNETCPYCKQVKEELNKAEIEFIERLTKDWPTKWADITNLTGIPTVPTIEYNNEYFIPGRDFNNPKNLIDTLENHKKSSYSQSKIILERLKTLNFNISMAFSRTDQLLRKLETKLNTEENEHKSTS